MQVADKSREASPVRVPGHKSGLPAGIGTTCPNCSEPVSGNFCPTCGQRKQLHDDNFLQLLSHTLANIFDYDAKFWVTMRVLLFNPGGLTLAYFRKQRARYVAPVSLYIFVSLVYFVLTSLLMQVYIKTGLEQDTEPVTISKKKN